MASAHSDGPGDYVPIRYTDGTVWDEIREQCAHLVALNEHTDRQICTSLGMEIVDLVRLRSNPKFMERVAEIAEDIQWTLIKQGICNKQNRLNELNRRWDGLKRVVFDRSQDPDMQKIPGGQTGYMKVEFKAGGRLGWQEEYQVDVALLAEMRAMELQAAKELGQIADKVEINSTHKSLNISVITELDRYEHAFLQAIEMNGSGGGLPDVAATPPTGLQSDRDREVADGDFKEEQAS